MTAKRKPVRDRELVALEKVVPALRALDRQMWQNGRYMGGRKPVRRVLAYLNERFPEQ